MKAFLGGIALLVLTACAFGREGDPLPPVCLGEQMDYGMKTWSLFCQSTECWLVLHAPPHPEPSAAGIYRDTLRGEAAKLLVHLARKAVEGNAWSRGGLPLFRVEVDSMQRFVSNHPENQSRLDSLRNFGYALKERASAKPWMEDSLVLEEIGGRRIRIHKMSHAPHRMPLSESSPLLLRWSRDVDSVALPPGPAWSQTDTLPTNCIHSLDRGNSCTIDVPSGFRYAQALARVPVGLPEDGFPSVDETALRCLEGNFEWISQTLELREK